MNALHWSIYLIRLALHCVLSLCFRLYLFAVFCAKPAAPILLLVATAILLIAIWEPVTPALHDGFRPLFELLSLSEQDRDLLLPFITALCLWLMHFPLNRKRRLDPTLLLMVSAAR